MSSKWLAAILLAALAMAHAHAGLDEGNAAYERGVARDDAEAVKWYRRAAEQGRADAQFNLGNMLRESHGVAKNEADALKWYCRAADKGLADAQYNLGVTYAHGEGVAKDVGQARKWFGKAAEQGYTPALQALEKLGKQ